MAFKGQAQTVWDRVNLASIHRGQSRHTGLRRLEGMKASSKKSTLGSLYTAYLGIYSCLTFLFFHLFGFMISNGLCQSFTCCQRKHHCLFSNTPPSSFDLCSFYSYGNTCTFPYSCPYSQVPASPVSQHLALHIHNAGFVNKYL